MNLGSSSVTKQWQDGSTHSLLVQYIGFIYTRSTGENFVVPVHHIKRQLDLLNSVLVDALIMIIGFYTRVTFSYIIYTTYFYCDKLFFPSNIDCTCWLLHCLYLHHNVVYYAILALECLFKLHDFGTTTMDIYRQVSNIRPTLVGNWIVDHSDVVGASPVGAAPTTSSFST